MASSRHAPSLTPASVPTSRLLPEDIHRALSALHRIYGDFDGHEAFDPDATPWPGDPRPGPRIWRIASDLSRMSDAQSEYTAQMKVCSDRDALRVLYSRFEVPYPPEQPSLRALSTTDTLQLLSLPGMTARDVRPTATLWLLARHFVSQLPTKSARLQRRMLDALFPGDRDAEGLSGLATDPPVPDLPPHVGEDSSLATHVLLQALIPVARYSSRWGGTSSSTEV